MQSITLGSLLGNSPVTVFIESATGMGSFYSRYEAHKFAPEGGKTGVTAILIGLMFFVSVFFAPLFAFIPSWATSGALVIVGSLMIRKCVSHTELQSSVLIITPLSFKLSSAPRQPLDL